MPRDIIYFDLETQRTANDAGGWTRKGDMRMSVGVIFSTGTGRYEVFGEAQVNRLIERLRRRPKHRSELRPCLVHNCWTAPFLPAVMKSSLSPR